MLSQTISWPLNEGHELQAGRLGSASQPAERRWEATHHVRSDALLKGVKLAAWHEALWLPQVRLAPVLVNRLHGADDGAACWQHVPAQLILSCKLPGDDWDNSVPAQRLLQESI